MKSWTWLSTFLLITTFLMVIDRGETKRMTSSDLEAGEQLSNKYPFEQSPPPGCQEGQFGIVYVVYGRNSDMQRDLEIMLTYLDTFFTTVYGGKLPVYRGQQVSVSIVCSPAAAVMVERLLRAPDYRRIALQYDVRLVRAKGTGGEDFKATRIYMQRYFAPVQYALFLDLDSLPRPNFLAMFDHLLQGPYDMVDSYAKIPFGQSVKISRSFSVGYITNQTLNEELYHFVERNGGTIAYNMHSPAVLNLLDLEYQLVNIYSRGTTIGDQLGLRLAIFISTHLWSAPFALREMSLSWEHEVCRGAVSAAVLRNCLFHHQPHPQRLDLAEQVQKWSASLLEAMSEPLPTDSLVSRLKKLDDMITHFDQQSSLQTAAEKKNGRWKVKRLKRKSKRWKARGKLPAQRDMTIFLPFEQPKDKVKTLLATNRKPPREEKEMHSAEIPNRVSKYLHPDRDRMSIPISSTVDEEDLEIERDCYEKGD